jgi:hypothetical protein
MPGRCASSTLCEALSREHFQDSWQELFCTGLRRTVRYAYEEDSNKESGYKLLSNKKIELLFLLFEKQHIRKKGAGECWCLESHPRTQARTTSRHPPPSCLSLSWRSKCNNTIFYQKCYYLEVLLHLRALVTPI